MTDTNTICFCIDGEPASRTCPAHSKDAPPLPEADLLRAPSLPERDSRLRRRTFDDDALRGQTTITPDVAALTEIAEMLLGEVAPEWRDNAHMRDTPKRYAKWWSEFIGYEPGTVDTTFPVEHVDQMVVVSGIDTWSLCAHHLLPFSATVSVGYIADEQVLGLSKFARIAHAAAHRPTSQEQLVADIADEITKVCGTPDVAVTASGMHLCMAMRGVKTPATMTTSVTRGLFREDERTRNEWFALLDRKQG